MENNFSNRIIKILNKVEEISKVYNVKTIGSEYLLFAMYELSDSLCRFLFDEYSITKEELIVETQKLIILRNSDSLYSKEFEDILLEASKLTQEEVSDEHIFKAILENDKCIAHKLLIKLGLDISDLKEDVNEIYDFQKESLKEIPYTINITNKVYNKEISDFINIEKYIERIMTILNRKTKNNPILVGNAGVGKTALVEGVSKYMVENNIKTKIISLNLASMLAGTKYRGDFEKRVDDIIKTISKQKDIILFIDEIHTIVGAGTTENSLDIANMLKPFLARSDFKVIGATTIQEYHKTIEKDKALNRRFQSIFIKEPTIKETMDIILGIKDMYSKYHNVLISDDVCKYLVKVSNSKIINKYRPDKCIDVLDEVLSFCSLKKCEQITTNDVDTILQKMLGYEKYDSKFNFEITNKFNFLYKNDLKQQNTLLNIGYKGNDYGLGLLIDDFKSCFGITSEMVLNIDMNNYTQNHLISSLIGCPPGYIGYNDEGILSKHILEYPMSIVTIKNMEKAASSIMSLFNEITEKGYFYDRVGNKIQTSNLILITKLKESKSMVGFNKDVIEDENTNYDDIVIYNEDIKQSFNDRYKKILKQMNIETSIDFTITKDLTKKMNDVVYELYKENIDGVVEISNDNGDIKYKKDLVN